MDLSETSLLSIFLEANLYGWIKKKNRFGICNAVNNMFKFNYQLRKLYKVGCTEHPGKHELKLCPEVVPFYSLGSIVKYSMDKVYLLT